MLPSSISYGLWALLPNIPRSTSPPIWTPHQKPSSVAMRPTLGRAAAVSLLLKSAPLLLTTEKNNFSSSRETWTERALYHLTIVLASFPPLPLFSSLTNRFVTTPWPKLFNSSCLFCSSPLPSLLTPAFWDAFVFCLLKYPLELHFLGLSM